MGKENQHICMETPLLLSRDCPTHNILLPTRFDLEVVWTPELKITLIPRWEPAMMTSARKTRRRETSGQNLTMKPLLEPAGSKLRIFSKESSQEMKTTRYLAA